MGNESDEDHSKRIVWTVADDKLLAATYTIISEDSVVGNAQKNDGVHKYLGEISQAIVDALMEEHMEVVYQILVYLNMTQGKGFLFNKNEGRE
ncbi:hypothetical protein ZIOFF_033343 [Zingiber officinale]|uniref:Uncharacterized protein n=1 Tax=Zingiber officinale TaxID=94328 RepID=A0A8J5GWW9_ZINOF|nr:hypothetical protein ZIOFF_033343 [Zingiber officinale]